MTPFAGCSNNSTNPPTSGSRTMISRVPLRMVTMPLLDMVLPPAAFTFFRKASRPLHFDSDIAHTDIGDAGGHDGLLAVLELDELEIQMRGARGGSVGKHLVIEAQDIAVAADGGVIEVSLQPRCLGRQQLAAQQVAVERSCLVGVEHDQAHVVDAGRQGGPCRPAALGGRRRALVDELDVQAIGVGEVGEHALRLARRCDQLTAPRARVQQAGGLQLRPRLLGIGDDQPEVAHPGVPSRVIGEVATGQAAQLA